MKNVLIIGSYETGGGRLQRNILSKKLVENNYRVFRLGMGLKRKWSVSKEDEVKTYKIGRFNRNRRGGANPLDIIKYLTIEVFNPIMFFWTIYLILRYRINTVVLMTYNQISVSPLIASKLLLRNIVVTMHTNELICSYSAIMPFCEGIRKGKCGECMLREHKIPGYMEKLIRNISNLVTSMILFLKLKSTNFLADWIIFPSEYSKNFHIKYGVKKNKSKSIPCFLDESETEDNITKELEKKYKKGNERILLYLGRMEDTKGLDILLKSLKIVNEKNKKWKLLMVGDGNYLKKLKELAKEMKLDKKVEFIGRIPHNQVFSYYRLSDIVVIPSVFPETFCIVFSEASLCKKITISTNLGVMKERVIDGKNGFLIEPSDENNLSGKILYVLENFQKFGKIGDNAYQIQTKKYSSEKSFSDYLEIV